MSNYGICETAAELGTGIMLDADINYWAENRHVNDAGYLVIEGDHGNSEVEFPVTLAPEKIAKAHISRLYGRRGIEGVHPNNYAWLNEVDDYDAWTGDWIIQYLVYGKVIFS